MVGRFHIGTALLSSLAPGVSMAKHASLLSRAAKYVFGIMLPTVVSCSASIEGDDVGPLAISPKSTSIGELYYQPVVEHELVIHNESSDPVKVGSFRTSCACTFVTPSSFEIPGDSDVVVQVGIRARRQHINRGEVVPFSVELMPLSPSGAPITAPWRLDGKFTSWASLSEMYLAFGELPLPVAKEITNKLDIELEVDPRIGALCATSGNPSIDVSCHEAARSVSGDRVFRLSCALQTPRELGPFEDIVRVAAVADGESLPPIEIPVLARIVNNVRVWPSPIFLDDTRNSTTTITLSSTVGHPIAVSEIILENPAVLQVEFGDATSSGIVYKVWHRPISIATLGRADAEKDLAGGLVIEGFAGTVVDTFYLVRQVVV